MESNKAKEFLIKHGMEPERIDPVKYARIMAEDMERGLKGEKSSMPMIPTYICPDGSIPKGESVAVIDAGGTNFRCALVTFGDNTYAVDKLTKKKMPGIGKSASWDEFISFVADNIMPLMDKADKIGFCFSYTADISPDKDGIVVKIDKEVEITDAAGKYVGRSLIKELERRGVYGKSVVVINDTVAALLGASCALDKDLYSGFIGQISGTGTNTCCPLPYKRIGKLNSNSDTAILINLESGMFDAMPRGDLDIALDEESLNPGEKLMEKMTAGVYLGELGRIILTTAAREGLLGEDSAALVAGLQRDKIDSSYIDAWSCGEKLELVAGNGDDGEFVREISLALFERSARCMCANLLAIAMLMGQGKDENKPICVCAEGSLVDRSRHYRPMLIDFLNTYGAEKLGIYVKINLGRDTTLPGSAAAALLN